MGSVVTFIFTTIDIFENLELVLNPDITESTDKSS